jgi:hypothetical protein
MPAAGQGLLGGQGRAQGRDAVGPGQHPDVAAGPGLVGAAGGGVGVERGQPGLGGGAGLAGQQLRGLLGQRGVDVGGDQAGADGPGRAGDLAGGEQADPAVAQGGEHGGEPPDEGVGVGHQHPRRGDRHAEGGGGLHADGPLGLLALAGREPVPLALGVRGEQLQLAGLGRADPPLAGGDLVEQAGGRGHGRDATGHRRHFRP